MDREQPAIRTIIFSILIATLLSLTSSLVGAITFEIPHDDELYQVQTMQQDNSGAAIARVESALAQLQADVGLLRAMLSGSSSSSYNSGYAPYFNVPPGVRADAQYRACVRDLIDDQDDLLRGALRTNSTVTAEEVDDLRDQERRCRRYARRAGYSYHSYYGSHYSGSLLSSSACRRFDPFFDSWDDYVDWRWGCERDYVDYYDTGYFPDYYSGGSYYAGYSGYPSGYYHGDDVTHPYYFDTMYYGATYGATYNSPFDSTTSFTYDTPSYYGGEVPGVTRPIRGPLSYSPGAYTEWRNQCLDTLSVDGRLSDWCVRTRPYWEAG